MLATILLSLFIAFVFSFILAFAIKRPGHGPGNGLLCAFLIIFMFSWVIGGWVEPIYPLKTKFLWLAYFFIGLFIMLLLDVILPMQRKDKGKMTKLEVEDGIKAEKAIGIGLGIFFWMMMMIFILIGAI